jgi:hypothetical protein
MFIKQIPQHYNIYPIVIDISDLNDKDELQILNNWNLNANIDSQCILSPIPISSPTSSIGDTEYHLKIKILGMHHSKQLSQLLTSLLSVNYMGDIIDLEIDLDIPHDTSNSVILHEWFLTQQIARTFTWKYGKYNVIIQDIHLGNTKHYWQSWIPNSNKEIMLLLNEFNIVSSNFYSLLKPMLINYYLNPQQYDSSMFGISLQTQNMILGETQTQRYNEQMTPSLLSGNTTYFKYQRIGMNF